MKDNENKKKSSSGRPVWAIGGLAALFAVAVLTALPSQTLQSHEGNSQSETASESSGSIAFDFAPDSLQEIYDILYDRFYSYRSDEFYPGMGARGNSPEMIAEEQGVLESMPQLYSDGSSLNSGSSEDTGATDSISAEDTDYSSTTLQEAGVDEGDIVKTDGQYLYILRKNMSLAIVKANGEHPELVSTTELPAETDGTIQEMYLDGDALHIILTETFTELEADADVYIPQTTRRTVLLTYNIGDPVQPVLSGQISQDGSYSDSRKTGDFLYLFTRYTPDIRETYEESTVVPLINGTPADASDFYLPEHLSDTAYLVISSINTALPDKICESKVLVSGASDFYVSPENIYIANEIFNSDSLMTEITKFHYENGDITGVAACCVKGYLNNSFSLNEHNGHLRVVTTYSDENWVEQNGLFIFDESLRQVSSIENLAEGETIRSARFFGDIGYFVTFRQTDPLFSVDLSDPGNPQILGELKISGFSSYLHFYGENRLLGIGYEADETTGSTTGIKLSMFDISDPANVTELSRHIIPGITWCPAIENYKSILVQPEKNLIGFYCDDRYFTFSYEKESGFIQELVYDFYSDSLSGAETHDSLRGLYIEDMLYLTGNTFVAAFDMEDEFEKTNVLLLSQ